MGRRRMIACVASALAVLGFVLFGFFYVWPDGRDVRMAASTSRLLSRIEGGKATPAELARRTLFERDTAEHWRDGLPRLRELLQTESWEVLGGLHDSLGARYVIVRLEPDFGSGGVRLMTVEYHGGTLVGGTLFDPYVKRPDE